MKTPESRSSFEQLKSRLQEVAKRITELDAAGTKNEEWNQLHNEHEELTRQIEEWSIKDDLDQAA
jgi:hypothetical protein